MAPKPRRFSGADVIKALGRVGFDVVAIRGNHAKLRRIAPDRQRQALMVPLHRELAMGTVLASYRQALKCVTESELTSAFFPPAH